MNSEQSAASNPTNRKRLQSCAIGCLIFIIAGVAVLIGGYYWLSVPGEQVATDAFLGRESFGLLHVEGLRDDEALLKLVRRLLAESQQVSVEQMRHEDVSAIFRILANWNDDISEQDARKALRDLPREFTVSLEQLPGEAPALLGAVNLNRFPRLLKLMFWVYTWFKDTETVEGVSVLQPFGQTAYAVTFVEHTLLVGQNKQVTALALRRLNDPGSRPAPALLESYPDREQRWNIWGIVSNHDRIVAQNIDRGLLAGLPAALRESLRKTEQVWLAVDILDEEDIEVQARLEFSSVEAGRSQSQLLQQELSVSHLAPENVTIRVRPEGSSVFVDLRLHDPVSLIIGKIRRVSAH